MKGYGEINEYLIGIAMKEAVRRAMIEIRNLRFMFDVTAKKGLDGELNDLVTSADLAAQKVYLKVLRNSFPEYGIVAEEDSLSVNPESKLFFTVDPLDGTRAFTRKQSHGIGTMISLVCGDQVIAAYVGDIMSQEIYGFRPGSDRVDRISEFDHAASLVIDRNRKLADQYILFRCPPTEHCPLIQRLSAPLSGGGKFLGMEITGGSIGISMARLWKGEIGAAVLQPGFQTPWDGAPVFGICEKLGFKIFEVQEDKLISIKYRAGKKPLKTQGDILVIHESRISEIASLR